MSISSPQGTICKAGVLWDSPQIFHRFVEDCGIRCEGITPHLLAAPFFRGSYVSLIVPTGFANRKYSLLLPVLRAKSSRIRSFVERGGRLLVFGAADTRADAYDWLPFPITYHHDYGERAITLTGTDLLSTLVEEYDPACIACDGHFSSHEATTAAVCGPGEAVIVSKAVGEGLVVVTSLHEYPSRAFLKAFSCGDREILF